MSAPAGAAAAASGKNRKDKQAAAAKEKPKDKEQQPPKNNKNDEAKDDGKKKAKVKGTDQFKSDAEAFVNTTPAGQKKDMTTPMADSYHPRQVESSWDSWWEKSGLYTAKPEELKDPSREKFVIVIPPPNVTGTLHIGHALTVAIEDVLVRWHRMSGKVALWIPGFDHAGIATQVVVEKNLMKTEGVSRHDLGREKFLEKVWQWKETNGNVIAEQLRRMGVSVDWSRQAFTMDAKCSRAVEEAFIQMFNKGLIYRSNRLVSWSCTLRTAISNIEVDYKDVESRTFFEVPGYKDKVEFGVIHSFSYKCADGSGEIIVATTRIETMLGDVAVAVHSSDDRYKHLHGKVLIHPFLPDRKVVVITDDILVKPEFGTGAVKVTPAHDPEDFKCGVRNNLQQINIFDDAGNINENGGRFKGVPRFEARRRIIEELKQMGQYHGYKNNAMRLGFCSRSGDVIEPVIRPQWWVATEEVAKRAVAAVRGGDLKIIPEQYNDTWYRWLENNQDWCISRQLWWGHRIPAYHVTVDGKDASAVFAEEKSSSSNADFDARSWVVASSLEAATKIARERFPKADPAKLVLTQDEDVLDTWFSSGLFPFSVFGWPNPTDDLHAFYPTTLLETGHDILFFWVARMVMMGLVLTDKLPFKTVYLHGLVRDKDGKKMSKSRGNVIDPLDVINSISLDKMQDKIKSGNLDKSELDRALANQKKEFPSGIPECGADALRFGLLSYVSEGRDINLDVLRIVGYRQFCNKLWNATRFGMLNFDAGFTRPNIKELQKAKATSFADRWVLSRLHACTEAVDKALHTYEFSGAVTAIYDFFQKELCDVYLELLKPVMNADPSQPANAQAKKESLNVLYTCFDVCFRLLHPLMPFVTEELYQRLPGKKHDPESKECDSIMIQPYPKPNESALWRDVEIEAALERAMEVVRAARSTRAALGTKSKLQLYVVSSSQLYFDTVTAWSSNVAQLAQATHVTPLNDESKVPAGCMSTVVNGTTTLHIPLQGLLDLQAELLKLDKKLTLVSRSMAALEKSTSAPSYEEKTPDKVKAEHKEKLQNQREELEQLKQSIATFEAQVTPEELQKVHEQKVKSLNADLDKVNKEINDGEAKLREDAAKEESARLKEKVRAKLEDQIKEKKEEAALITQTIADERKALEHKLAERAKNKK